jgi:REP element-mobilizing transposase RayT
LRKTNQRSEVAVDRYWLLTWTAYGNWLPGDKRGFVSNVRGADGGGVRHNLPGTPCDAGLPGLHRYAAERLRGGPVTVGREQAVALVQQFRDTAEFRGWWLGAAAVMSNHTHLVVGVPGDPTPEKLLRDFKAYGSRALNRRWPRPVSSTWWTESGSRRRLSDEQAVRNAVVYVRDQEFALAVFVDTALGLGERGA